MCSGNAETAVDLASDAAAVAPFGISCGTTGSGYTLKLGHGEIAAGSGTLADKLYLCCNPVVGKCSGNAIAAQHLDSSDAGVAPFGIACGYSGTGYTIKADHASITAEGDTLAAKRLVCCDAIVGKCSGNAATADHLDATHADVAPFGIDCGPGYSLKADHANLQADGSTYAEKRSACCDARSGFCSRNAFPETHLASTSSSVAPFGISCGMGWAAKPGHMGITASGSTLAEKINQCCTPFMTCEEGIIHHPSWSCGTGYGLEPNFLCSGMNCDQDADFGSGGHGHCCKET